ncbi:hypothetical protein CDAR_589331 [Caerostris darwini]|uniref:Uncharacterized protein n=1 Tax=Caerostris darwini TaxID=1538125 RepID=A0AAV4TAD6_9ARAC|nr:hypothetical protein CDAR_589331 [Caerostris darwini]
MCLRVKVAGRKYARCARRKKRPFFVKRAAEGSRMGRPTPEESLLASSSPRSRRLRNLIPSKKSFLHQIRKKDRYPSGDEGLRACASIWKGAHRCSALQSACRSIGSISP